MSILDGVVVVVILTVLIGAYYFAFEHVARRIGGKGKRR